VIIQPPYHPHPHWRLSANTAVEGKICQSIDLLNRECIDIPQNAVADFSHTANELTAGISSDFRLDVEKTGED
jgi:hypothetical protein